MRAELLTVGTELLLGEVVDTNAAWLGEQLAGAGVDVTAGTTVGDDVARIAAAVRGAAGRAETVVVTGGLGPTQDDLTREALARAAGVPLVRDAAIESALRERFESLRRDVPELNYRQADVPAGAAPLPNARGSAPGLRLGLGAAVVYALPGVPHEMRAMFAGAVLPDLLRRRGGPAAIAHRVVRTAGLWESAVAAALAGQVERLEAGGRVSVAFLPSGGQTRVRLTARAATRAEAEALLDAEERAARATLGPAAYGGAADTLEGTVLDLLRARGATLAVAESLTGGLLGGACTAPAGASDVFRGGVVAYAAGAKSRLLGVPEGLLAAEGAVSGPVAEAMARGARDLLGATYGLALTGVAGPAELDGRPVGTVYVGLSGPDAAGSRSVRLPGDRDRVRAYAVVTALDTLRRHLLGESAGEPD